MTANAETEVYIVSQEQGDRTILDAYESVEAIIADLPDDDHAEIADAAKSASESPGEFFTFVLVDSTIVCTKLTAAPSRTPDNIELFEGGNVEIAYQGATTYGQHLLWTPVVTANGQVGLHIRNVDGGQAEFLYFNPSIDERNVFIYHGGEFDPNDDPTECFIDVAEGWDE